MLLLARMMGIMMVQVGYRLDFCARRQRMIAGVVAPVRRMLMMVIVRVNVEGLLLLLFPLLVQAKTANKIIRIGRGVGV